MIYIRYRGGLGNQMFQYAFDLAMRKRYGDENVRADLSHYRLNSEHNGFELEQVFQLLLNEAEIPTLRKISPYYVPGKKFEQIPVWIKKILREKIQYRYQQLGVHKKTQYKQESHNSYESQVWDLDEEKDHYLDGLWQDPKYWDGCAEQIYEAFRFRNESRYSSEDVTLLEEIKQSNSVGIHVRRGDFVDSKFDICSPDYYHAALKIIREKVADPMFFFFSDEPEYVEKVFAEIPDKIVIGHGAENSIVDMEMLSLCQNIIISNSTFAWWGAWLGEDRSGMTIAPRFSIVKKDMKYELKVPEGWIQI